jgi:UDP:flavonoid glycosyltransferase YjiC (YdhE family)
LRAPEYYADIQDIYKSFPFDLLIADIAFTAIPLVKECMGIPAVAVGIVPLTETSKDLPPAGLGLTPSTSVTGKLKEKVLHYVADNILFKPSYNVMKTIFSRYGIQPDGNLFDTITRKASLVLQSGTPSFEYNRSDLGKNIRFIGPLLPYQGKAKTEKWFNDKLLAYKKVILVTQGTVERDSNKIIVPTLEAFQNTDHLVIVTTGGTGTKELQARYAAPNFIIEDFIPFADVMPYADVYITNGGYGGVLLSIQNKLPMVVAGVHEGKNEINARVGYFGLGINLKTELPKPQQIKSAVEEVLNNKMYAENVTALSEEFAQYNPQQLSTQYIEQLLQPVLHLRRQYKEAIY